MSATALENFIVPTSPLHDQFEQLRQTIAELEEQSTQPPARRAGGTAPRGSRQRSQRTVSHMSTPQATAQPGSNLPTAEAMLAEAMELGKQAALGEDVQVKWDLKLLGWANQGAIDLTRDKHGDGIDDAVKYAEAYAKGRNAAVIFNHKEPKQRKLAATTRTMIKLGGSPKYGVGEPISTTNDLMTIRQALRSKSKQVKLANGTVVQLPAVSGKLDDAHNTLMRFAREQLKRDVILDHTEYMQFCFRSSTEPREAADWLRQTLKQAIGLSQGKLSNCPDMDDSPEVKAIIQACNKRLTAIAKAKGATLSTQAA